MLHHNNQLLYEELSLIILFEVHIPPRNMVYFGRLFDFLLLILH